jgi:hypothetical protein
MPVLTTQQRNTLETAVKLARKLAETGARNALQALAIDNMEPFGHMTPEQRALRNRLRNKARLLGDALGSNGPQEINLLSYELAYENWHKMLFAKFLEANNLLMHPTGVAVTMDECEELAKEEQFTDKWDAAATYASKMLPAIFRPEDPLMQVNFASNDRIKLEEILDGLDSYIFTADDALGWVYQFWQSEAKEAINKSGSKIDGAKLPAVTQLFTEPYMVHFLIDNTIGAWWVSRHPGETPPLKFEYLRLLEDGIPAAGAFEGWPDTTAEVTSLDPCMGSGHFVASLFPVFAALRMHEEGLTKELATDKVIAENLHGLELDARCTQIAAFNVALTAWKFCGHFKPLPEMNLACSGIAPKGKKEDWVKLVDKEPNLELRQKLANGIEILYDHFQMAPELGSLLDPSTIKSDAFTAGFDEIQPTLAVIFLDRFLKSLKQKGTICCVTPQNWLFQTGYKKFREIQLKNNSWNYLVRLGPGAFSQISGEVVKPILVCITKGDASQSSQFISIDVSEADNVSVKDDALKLNPIKEINQYLQLKNPDSVISASEIDAEKKKIGDYFECYQGLRTGDSIRFIRNFWEVKMFEDKWNLFQSTGKSDGELFSGLSSIIFWENGKGTLHVYARITRDRLHDMHESGNLCWGKKGIAISQMSNLRVWYYSGEIYDSTIAVASPYPEVGDLLSAALSYMSSVDYHKDVRSLNQNLYVTNSTLVKVPFDLKYWQKIADEKYPNGLPKPYSDDSTQWLFHANPLKAENPLQVSIARLLGYRWPAETDKNMELAEEARFLIKQVKVFDDLTDEDGILCIPPLNGELAGSERLRSYLQAVYGIHWNNNTIPQLLTKEGAKEANLEDWLRGSFFEQHCKLFQNRPFIWHIWDGRKDGFSALVNYHKLDKENLQRLIFTYLGDWIRQCEAKKKSGESGAEGLLSAATKLKEKLEAILEGQAPYDIFVRWKSLEQQPIGWEPDLNDGIRLNIRPFVEAGVLRNKFNVKWGVDRGKNPPGSYWGDVRDNDKHLSLEEKVKARENLKNQ